MHLAAPLVSGGRELVGAERDGAGREGARDGHGALSVPRLVLRHDARVRRHVVGRELRQLVGLRYRWGGDSVYREGQRHYS